MDQITIEILEKDIKIINANLNNKILLNNKTIMDYTIIYIQDKDDKIKILQALNYVRLYKQIILPYKLLGNNRTFKTAICYTAYLKS